MTTPTTPVTKRVLAVDVLRGLTLALMILVNAAGEWPHSYWPLRHSVWNGCTPTDLVFPTFLFITGTSLVFSFRSRLGRGASPRELMLHTLRRAFTLFCIGVLLNGLPFFPFSTWRIYGVLQRIALCYLFASILYLWNRKASFLAAVAGVLLIGYWILMRWVPLPGGLVPGRDLPLLDPVRNWVAIVDRALLPGRLYEVTRDPEGLLSTFPAIATTLLGILTGMWLQTGKTIKEKSFAIFGSGALLVAFGLIWNVWFPINKKLWTSSYVLFAAGCALLALGVLLSILKESTESTWWDYPWLVFGTNPIAAYVLSELIAIVLYSVHIYDAGRRVTLLGFIFSHFFAPLGPGMDSLIFGLTYVLACFIPIWILYRRRIFIKI